MAATIREYRPDDLEGCRELWRHLTQRHRDIYDDQTIGGDDPGPYFDEHYLVDDKPVKVWVAEEDGELVGLCGLLMRDGQAELEPIVVRDGVRGEGIGSQLARTAVAEAEASGASTIIVRPVWRNVDAIHFFHREGFDVLDHVELTKLITREPNPSAETIDVHDRRFAY